MPHSVAGGHGASAAAAAEDGGIETRDGDILPVDEGQEQLAEGQDLEIEDVEPIRVLPTPATPSPSEVEKHRVDHWPPRSWCDECAEGFGREKGHFTHPADEPRSATISFDYLFVKPTGEYTEDENDAADGGIIILGVTDTKSKSVFAHFIPQKGVDRKRFVVDSVVEDVMYLGYRQVLLESDNKPAIVKLLKESLAACKVAGVDQVGEEHPPPYDSQANGSVEGAVKAVRGRLRTMVLCLEKRLGKQIPPRHPIMAWLVPHAAFIIRIRHRGLMARPPTNESA